MPKGKKGYQGRGGGGAAKTAKKVGMSYEGTLKGSNSDVQTNNEMRSDMKGVQHANPYPKGLGGGSGPGRS